MGLDFHTVVRVLTIKFLNGSADNIDEMKFWDVFLVQAS